MTQSDDGSSRSNSIWSHCVLVDGKFWIGNPEYLLSIPPRISKYSRIADDACIQYHIDIAGKDSIGFMDGCLTPVGNFCALAYPESLPERLALVSYLNEATALYDDFEIQDPDTTSVLSPNSNDRKKLKVPDSAWNDRAKATFSKVISRMREIDAANTDKLLQIWNEWKLIEANIGRKMGSYRSLEEYLQDRMMDIGWDLVIICAQFGANVTLTQDEERSARGLVRPLLVHGILINDYFSWEKEEKATLELGAPLVNAVALLMRLDTLSSEEARLRVKNMALDLDKEYLQSKKHFFTAHSNAVSPSLCKWVNCVEASATGQLLWLMTSYRHQAPGGHAYREYYSKRTTEGAKWFEMCSQSDDILRN